MSGNIETCKSGVNHVILRAQNDRLDVGPIETCNSGPNDAPLHTKTTDDGKDP